jgi:adenylate kinase family enzyme
LSDLFSLPIIHLDQEYWQPGWKEPEDLEWKAKVKELADRDQWIMEGNYSRTFDLRMPRADMIVYLDFSKWIALARITKRMIRGWGKTRPDMADQCPEYFDPTFFKFVWNFNKTHRPVTQAALRVHGQDAILHHLRSPKDVPKFMQQLRALKRPANLDT